MLFIILHILDDILHYIGVFRKAIGTLSKVRLSIRFLFFLLSGGIAFFYVQFSSLPLAGIKVNMQPYVHPEVVRYYQMKPFQNLHMFSGYGLFRSMTGVGKLTSQEQKFSHPIGNLPPSVVSRPEIILEGYDQFKHVWLEIPFQYKPGDIYKTPPVNFPHQPRLDWQMWFAALGSYEHNPWLVHLIYKLLKGDSPEVLELLDYDHYPFRHTPPLSIRAVLYEYDFTRLDTYWNRNVPNTQILSNYSILDLSPSPPQPWWQRKNVIREYLIPLDLTNPSMKQYLEGNGYKLGSYTSLEEMQRTCLINSPSNIHRMICHVVFESRRYLSQSMKSGVSVWAIVGSVWLLMLTRIAYEVMQNRPKGRKLGRTM